MSATSRARNRQYFETLGAAADTELIAMGTAPRYVLERQERREWLESNRNRSLEDEVLKAVNLALPYLPPINRRSPLDHQLSEAMDKGLLGQSEVSSLEDNPREVKTRLPKAIALMEECLEELVTLGFWKRSPNAPKLSE